ELYFVHSGTARVEVGGEERVLGPGGMVHVSSTTPRRVSNGGSEALVMLVIGGKGGYGGRDGHMVDEADAERRAGFGSGGAGPGSPAAQHASYRRGSARLDR